MGEIKFRAWDKKKNKMIYIHSNDSILLKNNQAIVYREDQFYDDEECFCCESINDVELLQYTGLKDKNDKEIYEGDIVIANLKYFDIKNEKCKVIFKDGSFGIQYGYCDDYFKSFSAWDDFEVIGNIYTNPDLIK